MDQKEPYFGSVRFFKNMILLAVVILIVIPSVFAIRFRVRVHTMEQTLSEYSQTMAEYSRTMDEYAQSMAEYSQYKEKYEAAAEELEQMKDLQAIQRTTAGIAEAIGYQNLYPDFYVEGPVPEATSQPNTMYLTFDDGPSDMTMDILSILAEKDVKATFFVVSRGGEASVERMREIVAQGHAIGMHSFSHEYSIIYTSVEAFLEDYYKLFTLIRDEVGITPTIFRFPGGSVNGYDRGIYQEIIAEMLRRGFVYYDWNLSAEDAYSTTLTTSEILCNVLDSSADKNRGIILMHDANRCKTTVYALADMIDGLREQGFTFGALDRSVKPIIFPYTDKP